MNILEISLKEGEPVNIMAFEVNLKATPPEVTGKTINVEKYIPVNKLVQNMQLRDAIFEEGFLNIYSCLFQNGKCSIFLFGNLQGQELKAELEFKKDNLRDFDLLNEKIKFLLAKSRNILKTYYKDSKIKNIEYHLIAFLTENKS